MILQDIGYLLSINKFNENSSICEFYTKNNGKVTGIIFGSTSKKYKSYLIIGNRIHLNYHLKNSNSIGNFKIEIDKVNTAYYFDNKNKFLCIKYVMQLIKILTTDNENNSNIYNLIDDFFKIIKESDWLKLFVMWELEFFKTIGFEINYKEFANTKKVNGSLIYVSKNDNNKIIPNFLIEGLNGSVLLMDLIRAFDLNQDFLEKSILRDNNLNVPVQRINFINSLNNL